MAIGKHYDDGISEWKSRVFVYAESNAKAEKPRKYLLTWDEEKLRIFFLLL